MMFCRSLLVVLAALIVVDADEIGPDEPTLAPTFAPTLAPFTLVEKTIPPTPEDTSEGTSPPTIAPTPDGTGEGTNPPTIAPTPEATEGTGPPTASPTSVPTLSPISPPTSPPTVEPTLAPVSVESDPPSDMPSDVPSYVSSAMPFSDETEMPSSIPTGAGPTTPGVCNDCISYQSIADLKNAVERRSTVCMCTGGAVACTDTSEDTITIASSRSVTIECVGSTFDCTLNCPNAAFIVQGSLFLKGNDRMLLTGGKSETRIYVAAGADLRMDRVSVVETSALNANRRDIFGSRRLQVASGNGAGVYNAGNMTATDCNFYNCTAQREGGAIYTSGNAVVSNTEFKDNAADVGGGIYVEEGTVSVTGSVFEGNSARDEGFNDLFVGDEGTVEGCENVGLVGSLGAACSTSTAVTWIVSLSSLFVGSLCLAWITL